MVLENVKEMWTEKPKGNKGKGVNKDRFVSKMYVEFFVLLCYDALLSDWLSAWGSEFVSLLTRWFCFDI